MYPRVCQPSLFWYSCQLPETKILRNWSLEIDFFWVSLLFGLHMKIQPYHIDGMGKIKTYRYNPISSKPWFQLLLNCSCPYGWISPRQNQGSILAVVPGITIHGGTKEDFWCWPVQKRNTPSPPYPKQFVQSAGNPDPMRICDVEIGRASCRERV